MERTLPPADAEEEVFLAAAAVDFLGVVDFFALVVLAAFVALVDVDVPLVFAIVETIGKGITYNLLLLPLMM